MNRTVQPAAMAVLSLASLQSAMAAEDVSFAVGLKAWANKWTTNVPTQLSGANDGLYNLQFTTATEVAFIPFAIARYKDWQISGSVFPSHDYKVATFGLERKEADLNFGYRVTQGIVGSLGYKKLNFISGASVVFGGPVNLARYEATGPYVGLGLTAPIPGGINFTGNFAYGRLKTQYSNSTKFNSDYILSELGFNYPLPSIGGFEGLLVGIGYRHQSLSVKADVFALGQRYRDLTQGLTVTLAASF